ncbi:MAG: DEAD/DEAH box helicase [Acetatifactor sp.]|nr:DEAD/DEAH box helicase [Acetatifactor sp.]
MGFEKLSPIQREAIPYLLDGDDVIGQAQTGTGKTAAFGIPILQKVDPDLRKLQAVILCPTRELAMQAAEELRKMAKYMHGIKVLPVYGGQEIGRQIIGLKGVQIIVGTPGRVMDHMRRHTIKLDHVNMVVLDEADEMLNMGFREDMETILGQIPNEHQTALFSATMPKPILDITNQFQNNARMIRVAAKELTIPLVSQRYYKIKSQDKDAACVRLLEYYQPKLCLIFCNTKRKVDELSEVLKKAGFQAVGLHGDMSQHQRDVAMNRFRNGSTNILIATDVAARGIDVDDVEAVINYDIPQDNEYYVHRIGRTGRAGRTGRSFTFAGGRELYRIREIERVCHTVIEEKKLPGAAKVLKAKADKYLNRAWELHEHEDMELMKTFLQRKMEEEGCDALELAAVMLKQQVGDKGPEIQADDSGNRRGLRFGSGRDGRGNSSRRDRRENGSGRDGRGNGSRRDRRESGNGREERESGGRRGRRESGNGRDERESGWRGRRENGSRRDGDGRKSRERDVRRDGSVRIRESGRRDQDFGSKPPKRKREQLS